MATELQKTAHFEGRNALEAIACVYRGDIRGASLIRKCVRDADAFSAALTSLCVMLLNVFQHAHDNHYPELADGQELIDQMRRQMAVATPEDWVENGN